MNSHLMVEHLEQTLRDETAQWLEREFTDWKLSGDLSASYAAMENEERSDFERARGRNPQMCSKASGSQLLLRAIGNSWQCDRSEFVAGTPLENTMWPDAFGYFGSVLYTIY
ncbi:hypothetical protein CSKR_112898 [Clonorchis sinensis]|uniref:Uncharacterized protein n=1 Tax=Clonorchis sinensis TaxID=79923 RepID=A0A3R7DQ50_CLOSI|nr:hypothetical protein CSKR_112898 [Clonorchis sinensis]